MDKKLLLIFLLCGAFQSDAVFFDPTSPSKSIAAVEKTKKSSPFKLVMIMNKKKGKFFAHFSVGNTLKKIQEGDYLEGFSVVKIGSHSVTLKDDEGLTQTVQMHEINEQSTIIKHKVKEAKKPKSKKSLKKKKVSKSLKKKVCV